MENDKNILAQLEALLFIYGEPIDFNKIAKILKISEDEVKNNLLLLEQELGRNERGLVLVHEKGRVQLATKANMSYLVEDLIKQEYNEELTPAALETLSIIAYAPSITRADLEYIRGVNSSFILRSLLMRGLVERSVNPNRGNAYIYNVSFDLLKKMGISKIEEFPDFEKYSGLVKMLYQESVSQEKIMNSENPAEQSGPPESPQAI
ncbi:MAG: SMC-Scp complex subunit ScpB [Candidatus Pacebacteria bacterium]|nr:SMC-Scp complex subunit ScpB [Candidatus Paceibacterota bacterium]